MKLVNILALTHAKLVNEPFVNSFENISFESKKVKRGDLFIAFDEEQIEDAILNGAYGIMFDKPTQITDSEIAWIKVQNLEDAIKKLLRFRLIEKEIISYECDSITLNLAKQIITPQNFIVVDGDIRDIFIPLWDIEQHSTILFCTQRTQSTIFTDIKKIDEVTKDAIKVVENTLFETSFLFDDTFYDRQAISPLFIPHLEKLLSLFKKLNIVFRIRKLNNIGHFEAVFVNKNLQIKEFGSTDRVIIFESDMNLVNSEIEFLKTNASWAKTIYLSSKKQEMLSMYQDENELVEILKTQNFNFALVVGADKSILQTAPQQIQLTLF